MTPEQTAILKDYILADPVLAAKTSGDGTDFAFIADALNAPHPSFIVWRSNVSPQELRAAVMIGATQLDALTASKRDSLLWVVSEAIDFTIAASRVAIDDLCGSQNTLKNALRAVQKASCTLAESLLATGTGTDAAPATLTWTGHVSIQEVNEMFTPARAIAS